MTGGRRCSAELTSQLGRDRTKPLTPDSSDRHVENEWCSVLIEGALSKLNSDAPVSNVRIFLRWPTSEQGLHASAVLGTAFCWTEFALCY